MFNFSKAEKAAVTSEACASTSNTDIRAKWKALAASRKFTASDIATLCIYRSMLCGEGAAGAEIRLRKSFSPVTNKIKLDNGAARYGSLKRACGMTRYSTVYSWLTPNEQSELSAIAKGLYTSKVFE